MKQQDAQDALAEAVDDILNLVVTETADAIIGEQPQEETVILEGIQAVFLVLRAALRVKRRRKYMMALAQSVTIVAQMAHYLYALGIRRGRTEAEGARQ